MPPTQSAPISIQKRLLTLLLIGLPLLWLSMTLIISWRLWHEINELNDTQITQLARYIVSISPANESGHFDDDVPITIHQALSTDDENAETIGLDSTKLPGDLGDTEDDYIGFAIWTPEGRLLMADENGKKFAFLPRQHGFIEVSNWQRFGETLNPFNQQWRLFYAHDEHTNRVIAVGQNYKSRREIIYKSLAVQIAPALTGLVLFIMLVLVAIKQGFAPLNQVSHTLQNRDPHDETPLDIAVPIEIQPLVDALNQLFVRIADTLMREQRFTADASHELRSPLTALKLQADVLEQEILHTQLAEPAEAKLYHTIEQLRDGIDRAQHLVEQLLILAKLAPEQRLQPDQLEHIDWLALSDRVLSQVNRQAREKHSQLKREIQAATANDILPLKGNPILLELLLRNLLDNAIRYCPENSTIVLQLADHAIHVIDNGLGVNHADLVRLSERFFRPAGQNERGSGLGLSIVKRIAELHDLHITLANVVADNQIKGFKVSLQP